MASEEFIREDEFKCSICGEICDKELFLVTGDFVPTNETWCSHCAEEKGYSFCDGCNIFFPKSVMTTFGRWSDYCPTCVQKLTKECPRCGTLYFKSHAKSRYMCNECKDKKDYLSLISKMNFSELKTESIGFLGLKRSPTVALMTALHKSKEWQNEWGEKTNCYYDALLIIVLGSYLVVIYGEPFPVHCLPAYYESETMTNFKRNETAWRLAEEDHELLATLRWSDDLDFELWETPFNLRAQTNFDNNYGKEWRGGAVVIEGNNYGDTSDFWIIGKLKEKRKKKPSL